MGLRFAGEPDLAQEEMKLARPPKGEIALGASSRTSLVSSKRGGDFKAGRLVQGRRGLFKQ